MTFTDILASIPTDPVRYGGRSGRKEAIIKMILWFFLLPVLLAVLFLSGAVGVPGPVAILALSIPPYFFIAPVMVRRLRDSGNPVWYYPIFLALAIGFGVVLERPNAVLLLHAVLAAMPSKPDAEEADQGSAEPT